MPTAFSTKNIFPHSMVVVVIKKKTIVLDFTGPAFPIEKPCVDTFICYIQILRLTYEYSQTYEYRSQNWSQNLEDSESKLVSNGPSCEKGKRRRKQEKRRRIPNKKLGILPSEKSHLPGNALREATW